MHSGIKPGHAMCLKLTALVLCKNRLFEYINDESNLRVDTSSVQWFTKSGIVISFRLARMHSS